MTKEYNYLIKGKVNEKSLRQANRIDSCNDGDMFLLTATGILTIIATFVFILSGILDLSHMSMTGGWTAPLGTLIGSGVGMVVMSVFPVKYICIDVNKMINTTGRDVQLLSEYWYKLTPEGRNILRPTYIAARSAYEQGNSETVNKCSDVISNAYQAENKFKESMKVQSWNDANAEIEAAQAYIDTLNRLSITS